jgi:hypothetical protein
MWVVSLTPLPLYTRHPLSGKLGGPQSESGRYGEEKISYFTEVGSPVVQPRSQVAIPATLSRLIYGISQKQNFSRHYRNPNERSEAHEQSGLTHLDRLFGYTFCGVWSPDKHISVLSIFSFPELLISVRGISGIICPRDSHSINNLKKREISWRRVDWIVFKSLVALHIKRETNMICTWKLVSLYTSRQPQSITTFCGTTVDHALRRVTVGYICIFCTYHNCFPPFAVTGVRPITLFLIRDVPKTNSIETFRGVSQFLQTNIRTVNWNRL